MEQKTIKNNIIRYYIKENTQGYKIIIGNRLKNNKWSIDNGLLNEYTYIFEQTKFLDNKIPTITERIYCILNNIKEDPKCCICNKNNVNFQKTFNLGYAKYCSAKCRGKDNNVKEKQRHTNIIKYGVKSTLLNPLIKQKTISTNIRKYGIANSLNSIYVREKRKMTIFNKYGVNNIFQNTEIKNNIEKTKHLDILYGIKNTNKIKVTNIIKYGYSNVMYDFSIKDKMIKTRNKTRENNYIKNIKIIEPYFNFNINKAEFGIKGISGPYILECKQCGNIIKDNFIYNENRIARCFHCYPKLNATSKPEFEIINIIKEIYPDRIIDRNNKKILNGKELDIYLPGNNLAIEYNGLYFHSIGKSKHSMFDNSLFETKLKNNHLYKTTESQKQNIQLLHIFENEWIDNNKQNIWKSIIKTKLGLNDRVFARNTYINIVSNKHSKDFLNKYHLQGNINANVKIGLFSKNDIYDKNKNLICGKNELLSLMTFGKSRYKIKSQNSKNVNNYMNVKQEINLINKEWELLRFVTRSGISITGGASKIFKYFLDNYVNSGQKIKTFADLRYSNGNIYKTLGFGLINQSNPNYFYFKEGTYKLENRISYQKHKLKDKLGKFDNDLSESENMYNNGYRKIYDSGNLVFEFIK